MQSCYDPCQIRKVHHFPASITTSSHSSNVCYIVLSLDCHPPLTSDQSKTKHKSPAFCSPSLSCLAGDGIIQSQVWCQNVTMWNWNQSHSSHQKKCRLGASQAQVHCWIVSILCPVSCFQQRDIDRDTCLWLPGTGPGLAPSCPPNCRQLTGAGLGPGSPLELSEKVPKGAFKIKNQDTMQNGGLNMWYWIDIKLGHLSAKILVSGQFGQS